MKPKRKVVMRSPYRSVGLVACSWLQATPIEHESFLERRSIQRMLVTPGVTGIVSQPFQIGYGHDNEKFYTPDFLVHFGSKKSIVVEIKPERFVGKFAEMFDLVSAVLNDQKMSFHVITDTMIDIGDNPDDIELVLRYARGNIPQAAILAPQRLKSVRRMSMRLHKFRRNSNFCFGKLAQNSQKTKSSAL
jgi:hypothetical protein